MSLQSLETLDHELRKGEFQRAYLILGPEQYQCRQAVALLKGRMLTPEMLAFDYSEFEAGETQADEIVEAANTFPMVSKRRVVLVTRVERLSDTEQEAILSALDSLSPRTILILVAEDLDRRKKFYKVLQDKICVAEFPQVKGAALERWAEDFVRQRGYRMSRSSIQKVVQLAGTDIQSVAAELEKLLLYSGAAKEVPDEAVGDLVRESRQQRIFDLTDAVGRRDRVGALKSLANLLSLGESPLLVVAMMARQCRQVLIAQECLHQGTPAREIASVAQIPPFMLDQFLRQARSANPAAIREMFIRLAGIDRKLKSSSADGRILLEHLICALV